MPKSEDRRQWTTDDIYEALKNRDRDKYPIASAGEIAELVGCSKPTVHDRLKELEDAGKVNSTQINRGKAFWLVGERVRYLEGTELNQPLPTDHEDEDQVAEEDDDKEVMADGGGAINEVLQASVLMGFLFGIGVLVLPVVAFIVDVLSPGYLGPEALELIQRSVARSFPDYAVFFFLIAIAAYAALQIDMTRRIELKIAEFRRFMDRGLPESSPLVDLADRLTRPGAWVALLLLLGLFVQTMAYPGIEETGPVPPVILLLGGLILGGLAVITKAAVLIIKYRRAVEVPSLEESEPRVE